MLTFSANILAEMATGNPKAFICIHIIDANDTLILAQTTHWSDVTLSNSITYEKSNEIISIEPPQINTTVDREQYKIVLGGTEFLNLIGTEGDLVGCRLEVILCFLNSSTGQPYTDISDTLIFYKGRVYGINGEFDLEDIGEQLYTISGVSPIMSLDMTNGMLLTREATRMRNENDSCCDQIYEGSGALVLKWGRI